VSPMSNALIALIIIALMLTAAVLWSQAMLIMMDSGIQSWKQMVETVQEVNRTDIVIVDANYTAPYAKVLVHNCGKLHIAQFENWDVFIQHYDSNNTMHIGSLSYTENGNPSPSEWTVSTIYADTDLNQTEVYEPEIMNPGEVAWFKLNINPAAGNGTTNMVTLSSPNGVITSRQFQG